MLFAGSKPPQLPGGLAATDMSLRRWIQATATTRAPATTEEPLPLLLPWKEPLVVGASGASVLDPPPGRERSLLLPGHERPPPPVGTSSPTARVRAILRRWDLPLDDEPLLAGAVVIVIKREKCISGRASRERERESKRVEAIESLGWEEIESSCFSSYILQTRCWLRWDHTQDSSELDHINEGGPLKRSASEYGHHFQRRPFKRSTSINPF